MAINHAQTAPPLTATAAAQKPDQDRSTGEPKHPPLVWSNLACIGELGRLANHLLHTLPSTWPANGDDQVVPEESLDYCSAINSNNKNMFY